MGAREPLLQEQIDYYRERAAEYDEWWLRRGRYDRGAEANARWHAETAELERTFERWRPRGRVLELACGTGRWSERLAPAARSLTAVDASAEMLQLCRQRVQDDDVEYVQADIFDYEPEPAAFDVCFFAFWLSHVPASHLAPFWAKVGRALAPGGRVLLIDSASRAGASARDHEPAAPGQETERRRLNDGREFRIVKHWFRAAELQEQIEALGWAASVSATPTFFVYGSAKPPPGASRAPGSRQRPPL
jgi:demethylmenaquinone methyltransferase/2-methoxy-6-polyprenyl-1,4-benzoquinol methylase